MSSKAEILNIISLQSINKQEMPDLKINAIQYDNLIGQFISISVFVGGKAVLLEENGNINNLIKQLYPEAENIASNLPFINIANYNPDEFPNPRLMDKINLAIIEGNIGVAENGCVWIPQNVKERALYFITENLLIILDKNKIVNNMHEAYQLLAKDNYGFGTFISGPSKTADIEQALVIGAHGATSVTVVLI